jgi:MOSC domain-containing protein YiiM
MTPGRIEAIHIAGRAEAPLVGVPEVRAIAGVGLAGDRYAERTGTYAGEAKWKPGRQITLIEAEAVEALARDLGLVVAPSETRRNLLTRGVALNHLVGVEFSVGEVRLRGFELCEPCAYLARITGKPEILPALVHRGGLRAEILSDGMIRVGDPIAG